MIGDFCDVCGQAPVLIAVAYGEIETKYCSDCAFRFEPSEAKMAHKEGKK